MSDVKPVRLQLSRRKGFDLQKVSLETNGLPAVNCARPGVFGNRFTVKECGSAEDAVDLFEHDLDKCAAFHPRQYQLLLEKLRGRNVACWCRVDADWCHADIWLERACDPPSESGNRTKVAG